jgi:hypothetical protein
VFLIVMSIRRIITQYKRVKYYGRFVKHLAAKSSVDDTISIMRSYFSDWALLQLAIEFNWSYNSVMCLPKLYFEVNGSSIIIYEDILKCLPVNTGYFIQKRIGKVLVQVKTDREHEIFLKQIALRYDKLRSRNPFPSKKSYINILNQILMDIEPTDSVFNATENRLFGTPIVPKCEYTRINLLTQLQVLNNEKSN